MRPIEAECLRADAHRLDGEWIGIPDHLREAADIIERQARELTDANETIERHATELDRVFAAIGPTTSPEDGAGALAERAARALEEAKAFREALGYSTVYPVDSVLRVLIESARHTLEDHDCDAHGHEVVRGAKLAGERILDALSKLRGGP